LKASEWKVGKSSSKCFSEITTWGIAIGGISINESSPKKIGQYRKYEDATKKSKLLYDASKKLLPAGVESNFRTLDPYPFFIKKGLGSRIWDVDGNEYIDFLNGQGMILLGHNHPTIREAVARQMENGMGFAIPTELVLRGAKLVCDLVPSIDMVRFCNSGTEATMHAIRVARGFTGKEKIAKSEGGYHGVHDQVLWSLYAPEKILGDRRAPQPAIYSYGVPKCISELAVIIPYNDLEATERILRKNADSLAALILEPVAANAGCLLPRDGYLQEVEKICRENDILLILDEVITGFRLGPGGGQERFGIHPDLTCLGKAMGGGMPVAAFGGRREIMEKIIPDESKWPTQIFHGGTYNAHPVCMAASIAALQIFKEGKFYPELEKVSNQLFKALGEITQDFGIPSQVSHIGSMGFIYITEKEVKVVRDALFSNWKFLKKWGMEALQRGVLFGHPEGEKIILSAGHTKKDIEIAIEIAKECFRAIKKK